MLLSDYETLVRQDLFDPAGANQRWATSDIDRALDKAIDKYSKVYPNIIATDLATIAYQRTYAYPTPSNAIYPVWWIEEIFYPLQVLNTTFAAPATAPTLATAAGTALSIGVYQYLTTYQTQGGETTGGPAASITTTANNQNVQLTNVPLGPAIANNAVPNNTILNRNLYRTKVGGSTFYYLASINDNITTTYTDTTPDASLGIDTPPTVNTSGVMMYPPKTRDFSEYSNIYDTDVALGTNNSRQNGPGTGPSFTMKLSMSDMPADATGVIRVHYATKHQVDASGTTVPEVHKDIIVLGACAYAMLAYAVPTNDNFEFQDGALRDKLDDTKSAANWMIRARYAEERFEQRLNDIKRERDFASSARVHWGDVAARWDRT